ncbi:SusC/RagA family TonB-linked outer membrane protein [Alloprevotella sp. OH1205_COT-284]|uniref:SusC/RagA family TonB-linked outer membrane protein n=1 Tax=Alloprevotella sp. OH1205_COT-284 TaxID=2491043 RepID=UPI000F5EB069|nr:SusC/RagA family TonB-linked outer membrane protein [Alloprevotella sp. OH1205_COT-284]RRD80566.1 SusC/RagA family TonB-linked outer membrane protein [Alloprevotella sp. OH1205_COT-284]
MNNLKYILTLAFVLCTSAAFAQQKRISGHVFSKGDGPVIMANVVEKDKTNRVISATQTDMNGNFSMTIKNPQNRLEVSYIGYGTRVFNPIGAQSSFRVELQDKTLLGAVTVTGVRKVRSNGLTIPEREISTATQTLNMDNMEGLSFETAGEALQGQIAGLDIVANSGNLGAGTSMRLRGVSSINGSQEPLIVVDNYPIENYNAQDLDLTNLENQEQFATLLQVAPEDIASIKVLKDAAATAIWGARGANGVIEITTRRGRRGKTTVNFSYRFSGSWQPEGMKMLDGPGYSMMLKEAYFNPKQSDEASSIVELMYLQSHPAYYDNYNKNTDWVKEVTQIGQVHNYGMNISGGGEKATFRVSGTFDTETGTIIKQSLNRFTTRLALDYFVSDRIKFTSNFALTYTKNNKNYGNDILGKAYKAMPNMAVTRHEYNAAEKRYFDTGEFYLMPPAAPDAYKGRLLDNNSGYTSYYLRDMVGNGNPVAIANLAWEHLSTYTITPQFSLEYKLLGKEDEETQLNYTAEVQMDAFTLSNSTYFPHTLTSNSWSQGVNETGNDESKNFRFTTRHSLVYRPYFENEKHSFQMLGRFELESSNNTNQVLRSDGISGNITDPTVPGYLKNAYTSTGRGRKLSGTTSAHYSYGSKYSIDFTLRADGMTKFGAGNKWGFFPGISGRWNISDETFFKPLSHVVNMLSFRPSYGINGNASFAEGVIYNKYGAYGSYLGTQGIAPSNLRLTNIRWEKTRSWNLGFDLKLFEDLLQFDFNIYRKYTSDLMMYNVRVPSSTGYENISNANVGKMENKGWEIYFNTKPIFKVGKFDVVLRANLAQNLNTITDMDASVLASMNKEYTYNNHDYMNRVQIGHALGGIYGFRYKGIYAYDYDHNGYFTNDVKNQYFAKDAEGNSYRNTAQATGKTAPIAYDSKGQVIYDKAGNPLPMIFNYGGKNYQFQGGDVIYEDINHDGQINELDIVYLGSSNPKFNGGFGLDFRYGRWSLKTNFNFRVGSKVINKAKMVAESMRNNNNQMASVNWRWRKNGDVTEIPRAKNAEVGESYNALSSDRYVESTDFVRFQYLQLGYSVDPKRLKRYGLTTLRISASGNNLIFWSKYSGLDPEHYQSGYAPASDNSRTPRSRSFTFSLNFGF